MLMYEYYFNGNGWATAGTELCNVGEAYALKATTTYMVPLFDGNNTSFVRFGILFVYPSGSVVLCASWTSSDNLGTSAVAYNLRFCVTWLIG